MAATLCVVATSMPALAQQGPRELDALLAAAVEQKRVPLVVATVADASGVSYEGAVGTSGDTIFAIASMTKPVTSVAVMQLVEAGRVELDAPASKYVPELAAVRVLDAGALRAPRSPITVRQLLSHTAGFGYEFLNRELFAMVGRKEIPSMMAGGDAFLKAPLVADPGTRWEYGINTDWLGRLVERVTGRSLEAHFRERIFSPLGMTDTTFEVPPAKRARMAPTYQRTPEGALAEQPRPPAGKVEFHSGGGGLFSTAADYTRFARALVAGGQLDGRRILGAASVATMGRNQIGDLALRLLPSTMPQLATSEAVLPGSPDKFGLGFALNSTPTAAGRGAHTMSWSGIFNTFFWIDRENQVAAVLLTQSLPFLEPGAKALVEDFDRAVYASRQRTR
jgi:CubicO group peptidase (beta-lactamase class C family)